MSEILCGKHTRKSSSILVVVSFDVHILTHNALISILCQIDSRCEWEIQCSFYTCNCDFFFFFAKWNKQERFIILLLHIDANNKKKIFDAIETLKKQNQQNVVQQMSIIQ